MNSSFSYCWKCVTFFCLLTVFSSDWQGALCSSAALLQGAAEDMQQTDDSLFIGFLFDILLYTYSQSKHLPFSFYWRVWTCTSHLSLCACTLCIQSFMCTFFLKWFIFVLMFSWSRLQCCIDWSHLWRTENQHISDCEHVLWLDSMKHFRFIFKSIDFYRFYKASGVNCKHNYLL